MAVATTPDELRALVAELQRFVARMDQYEHLGYGETRISTLFPLRDAARAVLHPTTSSAREAS